MTKMDFSEEAVIVSLCMILTDFNLSFNKSNFQMFVCQKNQWNFDIITCKVPLTTDLKSMFTIFPNFKEYLKLSWCHKICLLPSQMCWVDIIKYQVKKESLQSYF